MNTAQRLTEKYKSLTFKKEGHIYTYNGKVLTPVSDIVGEFHEQFDTEKHAIRVSRREGVSKNSVIERWKAIGKKAADFGTSVHDFAENYVYLKFIEGEDVSSIIPSNGHERAVINYWNLVPSHITPVLLEFKMYSDDYLYAGTCDLLLYNTITKNFILGDYKTNVDVFKNYQEKVMLPPFQYILDMPYNHYQLQLSLYHLLLEEAGYTIESRQIIWLLPDGSFKIFETKDFRKMLKQYLNENRR